jgi:hypothetical protein
MTDDQLAIATAAANQIELQARHWFETVQPVDDERNAAQATLRQAVALRKELERTIVMRRMRVMVSQ